MHRKYRAQDRKRWIRSLLTCTLMLASCAAPVATPPNAIQESPDPPSAPTLAPAWTPTAWTEPEGKDQPESSPTAQRPFPTTPYPTGSPPSSEKRIAYASARDGSQEITIMNDDGSNQVDLTGDGHRNAHPTWSRDGRAIAFLRMSEAMEGRTGPSTIYIMQSDGFNLTELTPSLDLSISTLAWSPDSQKIAFIGAPVGVEAAFSGSNIYVIDVRTMKVTQISDVFSGNVGCRSPSWSPDGSHLIFICRALMNVGMVIARGDGSDIWSMDFLGQIDQSFWLPSGDTIAYSGGYCEIGSFDVAYMLQKGTVDFGEYPCLDEELNALNYESMPIYAVLWSPSVDTRFLVQSPETIQIVDLARETVLKLHGDFEDLEGQVSWGPDEAWVVYACNDGNDAEIAIWDLMKDTITPLTDNDRDDVMPAWQP